MKSKVWFDCKDLSAYKNNFKVIRDLNLTLKNDEDLVILGPNGSGKSSIIDIINRNIYPIQKPNSYLRIFDKELIDIWELRKRISVVNNDVKCRISLDLKVFDLILSGLYGTYTKVNKSSEENLLRVEKLIRFMNLTNISNTSFDYLSDGEKQISLIARALINNPEIIILDEPGSNLDLKGKLFLINRIENLSKLGTRIVLVTHDMSLITKNYNRIILLKKMKIIADGDPNKIMTSENINKLFDCNVELIKINENWLISTK